jgi:hypothetical protein
MENWVSLIDNELILCDIVFTRPEITSWRATDIRDYTVKLPFIGRLGGRADFWQLVT